jgi:hypothetical protein
MTDDELQAARFNLRFQFVAQDLLGSDQEVNGWFQEYDQGVAVTNNGLKYNNYRWRC